MAKKAKRSVKKAGRAGKAGRAAAKPATTRNLLAVARWGALLRKVKR